MKHIERKLQKFDWQDPLIKYYHDMVSDNEERKENVKSQHIALMVIDLQYLDAAEGYGVFKDVTSSGIPIDQQRYYFESLKESVIPNVQRLLKVFRDSDMEVIHTRIQSLTKDGRDRSNGHKRLDLLATPGSKEAEFLPEVAPLGDEIIINKTASGVFSSTNLNYILNNLDIKELIVAGVYTNECVETTVRDACDLGYLVSLVEDACTTVTPELHEASIKTLRNRYADIVNTEMVEGKFGLIKLN
ncbi:MAG TPA: cysteine hydrolase family protein [Cyclobacteriaceae bacterium]